MSAQSFAPRKRTVKVNAATKNNVSSESNIVNAIQQSYDKKENSLTIKNPPEVVGAEVFKQLVRYPEFRLVFDCGAYTSVSYTHLDVYKRQFTHRCVCSAIR